MEEVLDGQLGGAARLLLRRGHRDAAAFLAIVDEAQSRTWNTWHDGASYRLWLWVPPEREADFTDELRTQITSALDDVTLIDDWMVESIVVLPSIQLGGEWRREVQQELTGKPANQATIVALPDPFPTEDRMRFRSTAELVVYRALKRTQNTLPATDTLGIAPNCLFRVPAHTWEPDFLVTYKRRCGAIFVDGPHHRGRYADDQSQHRLYENAGLAYIERIHVEDTDDASAVEQLIERFLYRLAET